MMRSVLIVAVAFFVSGCESELQTWAASVRSFEIKLAEPASPVIPKKSLELSGSPGEAIELRMPASMLPLEEGMRTSVRLVFDIKGKPVTSAVGFGEIKRSKSDVDELVFALRLPAEPRLYRMEIIQNQVVLLKGDFQIVKPAK